MLSIENPPPDLSTRPPEISQQLKTSDDKPSDNQQQQQQLDLLKSGINFSIRDYVSSTRSKDIKTNWPFSQQNLQVCLKHGVKELLPPFQSIDAVRNPYAKRCAVESISVDKENAINLKEGPSTQNNRVLSVDSNDAKPIFVSVNIDPSASEEDTEFPLTSGGQSCSKTYSLPSKKSPYLELKADTLPKNTGTKPEKKVSPASNKVENIVKPVIRKCKLIVKVGSAADPSSKDDNRTNNIPVSETMASKVCPVCKTFTSSSNTTLNAHIDQCLSGESTIKWTANPKVIKHRIKPRRMRTMVDIYTTALRCTLEDLDRRNGTNWASSSSLPARDFEACGLERKQMSPANFEGTQNEGAVYVDANGTKVRILSKFNDLSSPSKVGTQIGPRRVLKGDKGGKLYLTKKKKKKHAQKLHKLQTYAPDSKKLCPPKHDHDTEAREQIIAPKEVHEKVHRKVHDDQFKLNESGTMGGRICSKRTGLMKKMKRKYGRQDSAHSKDKESGSEDKELSKENSKAKRGFDVVGGRKFCSYPHSSPETNMNSSSELHDDGGKEFDGRKRARASSIGSQACNDQNCSRMLSEDAAKQLRKNGSSAHGNNKDHLNNKANLKSSGSNQRVEIKRASTITADNCFVNSKQSSSRHTFSSKSKKFSLRKNHVSTSQAPTPNSKSKLTRKLFALDKHQVHRASESDEEAMVWECGANEHNERVENSRKVKPPMGKTCDNVTVNRTRVLKARNYGGKIKISRIEEPMIVKGAKSTHQCHEHDNDDKFDSSHGNVLAASNDGKGSAAKAVQLCGNDCVVEPASYMPDGEPSGGTSKSSDVQCHDVASRSDIQSDSRQFVDIYNEPFLETENSRYPVEPIMSNGEIFCIDGGVKDIIGHNIHMMTGLDSNDEPGNYYIEVDPIPIPGPPGSFLPSPGRMTSEEFQGNSSLTSSRAQSSEGHPEFAERDFSDSPSATSTISDPDVTKFDSRILEKLQLECHAVQDEMRSSVSGVSADAVLDNLKRDTHAGRSGAQRFNSDGPKANTTFPEMGPFKFKSDQPCCCSRKEVAELSAVALNHQESSLLHCQNISTSPQPTADEQMNVDARRNFSNCNSMSEVLSSGDLGGGTQNTEKNPLRQIPNKASANCEVKFSSTSDGESASPCSNPVLRLMGKNLMVINKDEKTMPQFRSSQSPMMENQGNPLSYTSSGVYSGNVLKEEPLSSHPMVSQGNVFTPTRGNTVTQHSDVILSNGYGNCDNGPPQRNTRGSLLMLPGRSIPESCSGALESCEYTHGCYFPTEQLRAMNRFGRPLRCDNEKAVATLVQGENANSSNQNTNEIIIIDDAPENAADVAASSVKSVSVTSGFNPRHVEPFNGYQPHTSSPFGGPPLAQTATSQQMPYAGVSSSPTKWNCVAEVSNLLPKPVFPSSSPHGYHMRSTLYHSHGFS